MAKIGRPATENAKIKKVELEKLMTLGLSAQETADWFDLKLVRTLERYIAKEYKCSFVELRSKRFVRTKAAIKRVQIEQALKGNTTMLIWLGKQYLGQTEKIEAAVENDTQVYVYNTQFGEGKNA